MARLTKPQEFWIPPIFKGWKEHTSQKYVGFWLHLKKSSVQMFYWRNSYCWIFLVKEGNGTIMFKTERRRLVDRNHAGAGWFLVGFLLHGQISRSLNPPVKSPAEKTNIKGFFIFLHYLRHVANGHQQNFSLLSHIHPVPFSSGVDKEKKLWTRVCAFALSAKKE